MISVYSSLSITRKLIPSVHLLQIRAVSRKSHHKRIEDGSRVQVGIAGDKVKKTFLSQKPKTHSSSLWVARQNKDPFVKQAIKEGVRSRAYYKLAGMDDKYHFLNSKICVVDVGSAPGSWSQLVSERCLEKQPSGGGMKQPSTESSSKLVAVDLLPMDPIHGVNFIQGDFMDPSTQHKILLSLGYRNVNVLLSDIAPSFTGNHSVDHATQLDMCKSVLKFGKSVCAKDCTIVMKVLQGELFQEFIRTLKMYFERVTIEKPEASRKESSEMYCVMRNWIEKE